MVNSFQGQGLQTQKMSSSTLKLCVNPSKANCCLLFWQVPSMLSSNLNAEALQYLQGYLQAASVQLVWEAWLRSPPLPTERHRCGRELLEGLECLSPADWLPGTRQTNRHGLDLTLIKTFVWLFNFSRHGDIGKLTLPQPCDGPGSFKRF